MPTIDHKIDLSIIIVNWNTRELLSQCLTSISTNWRSIISEIIVVDNASTDGSSNLVESQFPDIKLIKNRENVGFVKANNQGAEIALGRYLLLLNSDTRVLDNSIDKIISFLDEHPDVWVVTGNVRNKDGTFQRPFQRFPHPVGAFFRNTIRRIYGFNTPFHRRYRMEHINDKNMLEVDWVFGAYQFVRRDFITDGKVFDEDIFMYNEDTLLCYNVKKAGGKVMYLPFAPIIHYIGASAKQVRPFSVYHSFRGSTVFFLKTRGKYVASFYESAVKLMWSVFLIILRLLKVVPINKISEKEKLFTELLRLSKTEAKNRT